MEQRPDLRNEVPDSPIKTKSFFDSVRYAFRGLGYAFRTERNFKLYVVFVLVAFIINLILGVPLYGQILMFMAGLGAFSAEMINTAIEHLANYLTTDLHESIRIVKDLGAASVLIWGFIFFPLEGILICQALLN